MHDLSDRLHRLPPRRICIIKPSSLGDVVHALPILPALRGLFPDARISWVIHDGLRGLIDGHPELDQVIRFRRGGPGLTLGGVWSVAGLCGRLAAERFDLTIDLQGLLRSGLMTLATRAPSRVGLADAREGSRWCYTHLVSAPRRELHAVERILRVAQALGAKNPLPRFTLPIRSDDVIWAQTVLKDVPHPQLVLNLGARWPTKRWPPQHFAAIARRAVESQGAGLIAVGSADDRPLVEALRKELGSLPLLDLSGRTSLLQLAALARQSTLFLSNDTGPLHVAAAAGATVVGIYTCTSPQLTGPFGPNAIAVKTCVWCAASFRKRCRRLDCFAELGPDRVWPAVESRLAAAAEGAAA